GFHRSFTAYLGEEEDIVAIYNIRSSTPFTGLVPIYLAERISLMNGILASSPEVIVPCVIKGEALFLRGVLPKEFTRLNPLTILEGDMLNLDDINSVIVGRNVAEKLGLKPNNRVLALGVLADRHLELQVKGIFTTRSAMDDEVLAPLYVGQWLRRADYGQVTLIRFKIDRSLVNPDAIFEEVSKETSEPIPDQNQDGSGAPKSPEEAIIPRVIMQFRIEDIGVEEVQKFMRNYMERYGFTREALLILSAVIFLFSSVNIAAATKTIIIQHKGEINILRSIGASKKLLKRDLLIKLLPCSVISSLIGVALAIAALTIIQECGCLKILSHAASFQIDPLVIILNIILVFLLISAIILRSEAEI
ncbi:FtsX-like permease family protein, partial [Candidatus Bathyarchaeota archaeon]|nr:FtsX-like permease family protein [Candidatus Bathyarchaeota archaeon]